MRKILLLLMIYALSVCAVAESYSPDHDAVVVYFQGDDEPRVKDAVWTSRDIFKVGMVDDGSRRDGFAQYVCEALTEFGFAGKGVYVQVIDIAKLMSDGDWVKLGQAQCR